MKRNELAIKGSVIGIASQIINLITRFIVRTFIIRILGKDMLGLDSVLLDTISMLSLAELGITSAMLYRLYAPVIKQDKQRINEWMATYRTIYHLIAGIIMLLGFCLSFALPLIIKDIDIPWKTIYIAFYLQLVGSVSSYLLSYQRVLLNADQKNYLCLIVDMGATITCSIGKVLSIVLFRSYVLYLTLTIVQVLVSNIALHMYSRKYYPYIDKRRRANREDLRLILSDAREVMANKLAGYAYNSTDNLIISVFLGTGMVGLLSNYKYISIALRGVVNSAMQVIQPIVGNYLNSDAPKAESYKILKRYTFIRWIIAGASSIPFVSLADTFVIIWSGNDNYLMDSSITLLLAIDFYIGCVYGPLGEYILGMGMFNSGKYATLSGAITNIVLSLIGVIQFGCAGVLLATVISQFIIWAIEIYIILFKYYEGHPEYKWDYIKTHITYIALVGGNIVVSYFFVEIIPLQNLWIKFIIGILLSETVFFFTIVLTRRKSDEFAYTKGLIRVFIGMIKK